MGLPALPGLEGAEKAPLTVCIDGFGLGTLTLTGGGRMGWTRCECFQSLAFCFLDIFFGLSAFQ